MDKLINHSKLHKLIFLLLIATLLCVTLVSCGEEPEELFIVNTTVNNSTAVSNVTAYISAVNGAPTNTKYPHGKYKSGDNIEITVEISDILDGYDYEISFKNGNVPLAKVKYPETRYVIVGLKNNYNIKIEVTAKSKGSGEDIKPDTPGLLKNNVIVKHKAGDKILVVDDKVSAGINTTITCKSYNMRDKFADQSDLQANRMYRFDHWSIANSSLQTIITDTNKYNNVFSLYLTQKIDSDVILEANYVPLVKTTYSDNVELVEGRNIHNIAIPDIQTYKDSKTDFIDGEFVSYYEAYFVPGDNIKLKFNSPSVPQYIQDAETRYREFEKVNYCSFNGWDNSKSERITNEETVTINIKNKENENKYIANTNPLSYVVIKKNGTRTFDGFINRGDHCFIKDLTDSEMINSLQVLGNSFTQYVYLPYNYDCITDLGVIENKYIEIDYDTKAAYTVYKQNINGRGTFDVLKMVQEREPSLTISLNTQEPIIGWKINGVNINSLDNKYVLTENDFATADSKVVVEARYTPYYTNYNGIIANDHAPVDKYDYTKAFDGNNPLKDRVKPMFYLPGLFESQSLLTEGIYKDYKTGNYILGGYVETNASNDAKVTHPRNSVLLLCTDSYVSTEEKSNILTTILLENQDGSIFNKKISSIVKMGDKLLISAYNDNTIYYVPYDTIFKAGELGAIKVEEFAKLVFNNITSLGFYQNVFQPTLVVCGTIYNEFGNDVYNKVNKKVKVEQGVSYIGEYFIANEINNVVLYHKSGIKQEQMTKNGFAPNNLYQLAKKRSPVLPAGVVHGITIADNHMYILIGSDDNFGMRQNNINTELYKIRQKDPSEKIEYVGALGTNISLGYEDLSDVTTTPKYILPPLIRDLDTSNQQLYFVSIGSSYSRYLPPSETSCPKPISTLFSIPIDNIK